MVRSNASTHSKNFFADRNSTVKMQVRLLKTDERMQRSPLFIPQQDASVYRPVLPNNVCVCVCFLSHIWFDSNYSTNDKSLCVKTTLTFRPASRPLRWSCSTELAVGTFDHGFTFFNPDIWIRLTNLSRPELTDYGPWWCESYVRNPSVIRPPLPSPVNCCCCLTRLRVFLELSLDPLSVHTSSRAPFHRLCSGRKPENPEKSCTAKTRNPNHPIKACQWSQPRRFTTVCVSNTKVSIVGFLKAIMAFCMQKEHTCLSFPFEAFFSADPSQSHSLLKQNIYCI